MSSNINPEKTTIRFSTTPPKEDMSYFDRLSKNIRYALSVAPFPFSAKDAYNVLLLGISKEDLIEQLKMLCKKVFDERPYGSG